LPIPQSNPELTEVFVYTEVGEGAYRPKPKPEVEAEPAQDMELAGLPDPADMPEAVVSAPLAVEYAPSPVQAHTVTPPPTGDIGLPELWRQRRDAAVDSSAIGAEARSLAAMFSMLAGKTNVAMPHEPQATSEPAQKDSGTDLFRRL